MSLVASLNKLNSKTTFTLNYNRLNYLLKKFNLTQKEFLELTNIKEKNLQNPVKIQTLKKIDKIFNQGLSFYYRKDDIENTQTSIFLRKNNSFETDLDLYSRKVIDNYEELLKEIHSLGKNIECINMVKYFY